MRRPIHEFIRELDASRTHYALTSVREGAVMVQVALPGERWEVEFFDDRDPEVEIFRSDGSIFGPGKLPEPYEKVKDQGPLSTHFGRQRWRG